MLVCKQVYHECDLKVRSDKVRIDFFSLFLQDEELLSNKHSLTWSQKIGVRCSRKDTLTYFCNEKKTVKMP